MKGKTKQKIVNLLCSQGPKTTEEMSELLDINEFDLKESMKKLLDKGIIKKHSQKGWTGKWEITKNC